MEYSTKTKPFRLGILGGMGPLAGVHLQRLIIEATPAHVDQDHIQVVCFTNPKIPDRTASLEGDDGRHYMQAVCQSVSVLEAAQVDVVAIPCNTAHARLPLLQRECPRVKFLNMVSLTTQAIVQTTHSSHARVLLLATNGTLAEKVYSAGAHASISWVYPEPLLQQKVMDLIYAIKARGVTSMVETQFIELLKLSSAHKPDYIVLGCTELSLLSHVRPRTMTPFIDPLHIMAKYIVDLAQNPMSSPYSRA